MKVGDLVMFRNCGQHGTIGVITIVCELSSLSEKNPDLALYWALCEDGHMCFTGNQLVMA